MDWVNRLYGSYDVFELQQEDDSSPLLLGLFLVNTMKKIHWPFFFRNSWWHPINTLQLFFSPSKHFWKRLLVRMDLLLSLFCSIIFLHFLSVNSRDSPPLAPALYVFGDSLFDSGNNNLLPTLTRANYLPYGVNFPGGVTGRFTNGRTVADFIGAN